MALEYLMWELKMGGKKEDIKSIFNAVSKWKNCIKLTLLLSIDWPNPLWPIFIAYLRFN